MIQGQYGIEIARLVRLAYTMNVEIQYRLKIGKSKEVAFTLEFEVAKRT